MLAAAGPARVALTRREGSNTFTADAPASAGQA